MLYTYIGFIFAVLAQEHRQHRAEDLHHGQLQLIRNAQGDGHRLGEPETDSATWNRKSAILGDDTFIYRYT